MKYTREYLEDVSESIIVNYDILSKNICNENLKIYIKNLVCYKEKVYNNIEMMRFDEIFMAGILAESFTELYDIMKYILSEKELDHFMGSVVNMSKKYFRIHDWAKEEMEKLVEEEGKRIDKEERERKEQEDEERKLKIDKEKSKLEEEKKQYLKEKEHYEKEKEHYMKEKELYIKEKRQFEQEKKQNIENTIINMLENNIDKDVISKITGLKVEEINKIEKKIKK